MTEGSRASSSRPARRRAVLVGVVGAVFAIAGAWFVGRRLLDTWDETRRQILDSDPVWLLGAAVLAAMGMTAIAVPWRSVLRSFGVSRSLGPMVSLYFVGEIGKYVPGGVWPVVGRGELAARTGTPRRAAYASVLLSLASLYLAGLVVVGGFLPVVSARGGSPTTWLVCLVPVGLGALHPVVVDAGLRLVTRVSGRHIDWTARPWPEMLRLVAAYLPGWLLIGSATWALSRALGAQAAWPDVVAATALSWAAGFIIAPVPGGVGVREAVFVAAVSGMSDGTAAAVAISARLLFIAVDCIGAGLGLLDLGRRRLRIRGSRSSEVSVSS